jgi:hypothetical protein
MHQVDDAPLHHVAMPDSMSSSPLVAALDPRVDEQVVQDQMQTAPAVDTAPVEPQEPEAVDEREPPEECARDHLSGARP